MKNFYQQLLDLGLVRVRLNDGSLWWFGRNGAEALVRSGKAEPVPLTDKELAELEPHDYNSK